MIRDDVAEVNVVPSLAVFLRGPLEPHWALVAQMWTGLLRVAGPNRLVRYRRGAQAQWIALPDEQSKANVLFDHVDAGAGCRFIEVAVAKGHDGMHLEVADLLPVSGKERASYVRVRFPKDAAPVDIVRLAEWTIQRVPLLWGSAGLVFEHVSGRRFIAYRSVAALAKRYWGVQIQDMTALQWDALRGMPSVNWVSLIGDEFAQACGTSVDTIVGAATGLAGEGVFHRRGTHGVALAAGHQPLQGDINKGEELTTYVHVARLLEPLLLTQHTPLAGPFARPEVLTAWLRRFRDPQAWLDCDITPD